MHQHERVLAEGMFRLILTEQHQIIAAIRAETVLGALNVAVEIDRDKRIARAVEMQKFNAANQHAVGLSIFKSIGRAAEGAFNVVKKAIPVIAPAALGVLGGAALGGSQIVSQVSPMLGSSKQIQAATQLVQKAKLGDLPARKIIGKIVDGARKNIPGAKAVADTLVKASRVIDTAVSTVSDIANPQKKAQQLLTAISRGDWHAVEKMAKSEVSNIQSAVAMIPGLGTAISGAIGAGMALIDGGSPVEIGIRAAYGAMPIPPGIRSLTDAALTAVLSLILHGHGLTDVVIATTREQVPAGIPREVFDALVKVLIKRVPIQKVGTDVLEQYVARYAPKALSTATNAIRHATAGEFDDVVVAMAGAPAYHDDVEDVYEVLPPERPRLVQPYFTMPHGALEG